VEQARDIGERLRGARKRRGLTQHELARSSGVSVSLIRKLEQGDYDNGVRLETVHKLAVPLGVPTSALLTGPDAPVANPQSVQRWEPVRRALEGPPATQPDTEPTLAGISSAFAAMVPALLASQFSEMGALLPGLLHDADALVASSVDGTAASARSLRAQIRQVAGSLMLHTWQFGAAERAFALALEDASDPLTACSVVEEQCWGLIRQGRLSECRVLAFRWADENEPTMSAASRDELAAWGRLLIRASTASVRDNRPGEAAEALRLARMAAAGTGRDFLLPSSPWHMFGPVTVSVIAAENAMIQDRPETVLAIAGQIAGSTVPVPRFAPSHRLDVAGAHAALRHYPEAVAVLQDLRRQRPQWLPQQRHAADILTKIVHRRRTLTPEMRELADALHLPL
jgi:transcriptional regulator with XRE-family HTH domain